MLKPQDLLVTLKLASLGEQCAWTYQSLAEDLGISQSEVHTAVQRARQDDLLSDDSVRKRSLLEFLEHGVQYAFFVKRGPTTRGIPTGVGAPPLAASFGQPAEVPVWPNAQGKLRGYALTPLYKSAPFAALRDSRLYELLAQTDAIREGVPREANQAAKELHLRLGSAAHVGN